MRSFRSHEHTEREKSSLEPSEHSSGCGSLLHGDDIILYLIDSLHSDAASCVIRHMTWLLPDVTSERWNMATVIFIFFFRDTSNTCFDIVFFRGVAIYLMRPMWVKYRTFPHPEKNWQLQNWQGNAYGTMVICRFHMMDTWTGGCSGLLKLLIHP